MANQYTGYTSTPYGRPGSFADSLVDKFAHIPFFSNLAYKSLVFLRVSDTDRYVGQLSMIYCALLLFVILPITIKVTMRIFMEITRSRVKGSGATGRWATFFEVYQKYSIPSKFSLVLSSYFLVFFTLMVINLAGSWHFSSILIGIVTAAFGTIIVIYRFPEYKKNRAMLQPYPLGRHKWMNIYLIGGERYSVIRGNSKEGRQAHMCIIGPSEAGKTKNFFIPPLLEDSLNYCSAVLVEAKAADDQDLFKLIAPSWIKARKKVILFDPWEGGGCSFNPLLGLNPSFSDPNTRDSIEAIVDAIYRTVEKLNEGSTSGAASYHVEIEKGLMKGFISLVLFKPKEQRNLAAVWEIVNGTVEMVRMHVMSVMNKSTSSTELTEDINMAFEWFTDQKNGTDFDKSKTLRGIAEKLAIFSHPRVKPYVVKDELDLDILFKEPTLFCIKSPYNRPGAKTIASIIMRLIMLKVPNKRSYGAGDQFKLFLYLDELPSLAIPNFDEFTKTARSSGTGIICAIQAKSDMADIIKAKLGITSVDGLLSNFRTRIYLPGLDDTTTTSLSRAFGMTLYKGRRVVRSTEDFTKSNYMTSAAEKPLATPDEITHMPQNQCIIVDRNLHPFYATTIPWYKRGRYTSMVHSGKNVKIVLYKKACENIEYVSPCKDMNYHLIDQPTKSSTPDVDPTAYLPGSSTTQAGPPPLAFESNNPTSNPTQNTEREAADDVGSLYGATDDLGRSIIDIN